MFKKLFGWFIPYLHEARFHNSVKQFRQDESTLGATIRKTAHAIDKSLTISEKPHNASVEKKLEKLLEEWREKKFNPSDESIKWAERMLEKYRVARKKSVEKGV